MIEQKYPIADLKIYQLARSLEDQVYELVKGLPEDQFYVLGNDLRRASAAVSHYITETHKRYSYQIKIESLHCARTEAEEMGRLLQSFQDGGYGEIEQLANDYVILIKQSWGLIKYLKGRQLEKQNQNVIRAKDELVAAKS